MKIKSFQIRNFKSLYNFPASKFGNINMVFGLNNSGKSNMLKFLNLVFQTKSFGQQVKVGTGEENRRQVTNLTNFWEGEISDLPYIYFNNNMDIPIEFDVTLELSKKEIPFISELTKEKIISNRDNSNIFIRGNFESTNKTTSRINLKQVQMNNKIIFEEGEYFPNNKSLSQEHFDGILKELNNCILFLDSNRIVASDTFMKDIEENGEIVPTSFRNSLFELYLYDYDKFMESFYQLLIPLR